MVDVVALCARGGHDGGVRDGGAVVAADSPCQAGGHADHADGAARREDAEHDGDQDPEGSPGGAGGEGDGAGHKEDDGRKEAVEGFRGAQRTVDEGTGIQKGSHVLQGGGHGKDQNGGNHGDKALGNAGHSVLEGYQPPRHQIEDNDHQGHQAAPGKSHGGVRVGEGVQKAQRGIIISGGKDPLASHTSAHIEQGKYADTDEEQHRNHQVDNLSPVGDRGFVRVGIHPFPGSEEIAVFRVFLMELHGAVIEFHQRQGDDKYEGQQGVEVVGDRLAEEGDALAV